MSEDSVIENVQHYFSEVYHFEWKLSNLLNYKGKKLVTPPFSPLLNVDVKFLFEIWFTEYSACGCSYVLFKFILVKLDDSVVSDSAKLDIEMNVQYSDCTMLKEYCKLPIIIIKDMDCYYFDEIHVLKTGTNGYKTESWYKLNQNPTLLLKCRMTFFGHLENSTANCLLPVLCSVKTPATSANDFKSFKRSDKFSDIIVCVGNKLFFSHKSVLSHHSSVLKEKISQTPDSESVLVLEDEMCDAFNSFLDYLYLGNFKDMSWPVVRDVYILSAKYNVDALKKTCCDVIVPTLSVDKICDVLKIAYDYDDTNLKELATKFAVECIRDVTSTEEWKKLIVSHPLIGYEVTFCALNKHLN